VTETKCGGERQRHSSGVSPKKRHAKTPVFLSGKLALMISKDLLFLITSPDNTDLEVQCSTAGQRIFLAMQTLSYFVESLSAS